LVTDANGAVVRHASALSPGDTVAVTLADGRFDAQVTGIDPTR
jgi:exonuclease VII large subunit